MRAPDRPYLLDATRLVARSWTGRRPTGIDRVCMAYLRQFRAKAQAVVQYRGVVRTLQIDHSDMLFDLLEGPDTSFRRELMRITPATLFSKSTNPAVAGATYINCSHTDFDLARHSRWVKANGLRPVYFLHDLIPITHPELCRPVAVRRHLRRLLSALRMASGIIVNSQSTADELRRFAQGRQYEIPAIVTAPLAGARLAAGQAIPGNSGATGPDGRSRRPYFAAVGTIEPRKNYLMLLRIWTQLAERFGSMTPRLVIAGQWGQDAVYVRRVQEQLAKLAPHVEVASRCDDRRIGEIVGGARALLLPTLAEGFGLPLVEALALGTPVIASDLPSLRETGQDIPLFLAPESDDVWRDAIAAFSSPFSDRERQLRMLPRFVPSTWEDHFARVEPWLRQLQTTFPVPSEVNQLQCLRA